MGNKNIKDQNCFSNKEQKLDEITVELQKIIEDIDNIYNSYFKKNVDEFMEEQMKKTNILLILLLIFPFFIYDFLQLREPINLILILIIFNYFYIQFCV